jgi:GNAT superfamily N-acetyltransferase
MHEEHLEGVVAIQPMAFPPPFDPELHWQREHLVRHLEVFAIGQWVAVADELVVGSCSNTRISEKSWCEGASWDEMVGGYFLNSFDVAGTTLFGLDISVHTDWRGVGIGRAFYQFRKELTLQLGLKRYATVSRIPDYHYCASRMSADEYVGAVQRRELIDRTLTPLLKYGLQVERVVPGYLEDPESCDVGCRLEWKVSQ